MWVEFGENGEIARTLEERRCLGWNGLLAMLGKRYALEETEGQITRQQEVMSQIASLGFIPTRRREDEPTPFRG